MNERNRGVEGSSEDREGSSVEAATDPRAEAVAIVGIGCRYADARGPEEFWEICRSERDTVRDAPEHRIELGYDIDHFYDPRPRIPGKISSKKAGFLEHPELFDPAAFGIAPRDALTMDPQQRLMVEVTWDALEDAGIAPDRIAGERVAVILGYMAEDYSRERAGVLGEEAVYRGHDVFTVGGMSHAVLSGRIAFLLGVTGPSFTLDTACSSSLIATHLACQSLRRGESNLAIAGGANLFLSPEGNIALSRSGMLSMSGACRAFDASADGFVRAEGAGVVVLKRLRDALADDDPIYAVIRGSGISTDGRDGGHMMAPGRGGQAQAMRDAYAEAGVDPAAIQYVETHGTGTMIGDPVEIGALADVMGPGRDPERPLRVASVKGNLGHTESASGVAGLIKACLAIRHRTLPKQLHFETPNPMIPWDEIPIRVQAETTPWPEDGPALVGVNSFGISGTNAHVVVESPPPRPALDRDRVAAGRRPFLLPLSAHSPEALNALVTVTRDRLEAVDDEALADLVYTHACRRSHRPHRLAAVGASRADLVDALDGFLAGEPGAAIQTGIQTGDRSPEIVMIFPGQGSQWRGMGRTLLSREPVFAEAIDRLDAAFARHVDWSLRAELTGDGDWTARLDRLQPILVAVEIALARLWESFGVRATRVVGQSMGEIAAAHVAGVLSVDDVARLACHRGRIVARATGDGAMAVVALSREAVLERLASAGGALEVAGVNSPSTTIVSGDREPLIEWLAGVERDGVFARRLEVDFASHCFHMDPLLADFRAGIETIEPREATIPMHSTVDGKTRSGPDLGPDYWVRNLREAVAFDAGLGGAIEAGGVLFLEVSPHPTLPRAIEEIAQARGAEVGYAGSLVRGEDEQQSLLRSLASLHVRGAPVDFEAVVPPGRVVATPLYPYQRERYWFSDRNRLHRFRQVHPLLGARSDSATEPGRHGWDFLLDVDSLGLLAEARLAGERVAPSSIAIEIALAVAEAMWPGEDRRVRDLALLRGFALEPTGRREVQVELRQGGPDAARLRISSRVGPDEPFVVHAVCELVAASETCSPLGAETPLEREGNASIPLDRYQAILRAGGIVEGERGRTLRELEHESQASSDAAEPGLVARLMLPRSVEAEWHGFHAHPALLEASLRLPSLLEASGRAHTLVSIGEVALSSGLGSDCTCRVRRDPDPEAGGASFSIDFFDRDGTPRGALRDVRLAPLARQAEPEQEQATGVHRLTWRAVSPAGFEGEREVRRWIVISDDAIEAGLLASELGKQSAECRFCEKVEDLPSLVAQMKAQDPEGWGLVLLAWGDAANAEPVEPERHRAYRVASWAEAIREHAVGARQFWIATRGLREVGDGEVRLRELGARVAQEVERFASLAEMQRCRLFDAGASPTPFDRKTLAGLMGAVTADRQFASRDDRLLVPLLVPVSAAEQQPGPQPAGGRSFRAAFGHPAGTGIRLLACEDSPLDSPLDPSALRIEVESVALSQLDVLAELGRAPAAGRSSAGVARDFAGVVREVGEAVSDLRPGDAVVGLTNGAFARRLVVDRSKVVRRPDGISAPDAAAIPLASVLARHALLDVGRLRPGERLFLPSAGGGVGHAMVELARELDCPVTATARTPERRAALAARGVRVLAEEPDDDEAFDVIVGSGSGPILESRLACLAWGGRYVDLSPPCIDAHPASGAARLGPNRSLSRLDFDALLREAPEQTGAWLGDSVAAVARDGAAIPVTVFPLSAASRALRFMAQNRHTGRVVISLDEPSRARIEAPDGGACVSLAGRGPVFVSGRGGRAALAEIVRWLEAREADDIEVAAGEDAVAAYEAWSRQRPSIGAWIHLASESDDQRMSVQSAVARSSASLRLVVSLRPAVSGDDARDRAWETRLWLDGLIGAESRGRPGWQSLSVSEAVVANEAGRGDAVASPLWQMLDAFAGGASPASECVVMEASEWDERRSVAPSPLLEADDPHDAQTSRAGLDRSAFLDLSLPERRREMLVAVRAELGSVLGLAESDAAALDASRALDSLGLDSLMTLELFMGLARQLEIEIARDWFASIPTLGEVASTLTERFTESIGKGGSR